MRVRASSSARSSISSEPDGHLQLNHGALHALVGDVGERGGVEGHLVGLGQREKRAQLRQIDGIVLEHAPQAGVDGEARGQRERGRLGQARLRKIVEQAGVVLVDGGERVLDVRRASS